MQNFWVHPLIRSRYPLAIVAGLALAASFPNLSIAGLAWIAPGLMLVAALGTKGAESFRIGYVAGLTHYLASLYWLLHIPYRWHGIPLAPAVGWASLSAFMALYPATWVWLVLHAGRRKGNNPGAALGAPNASTHGEPAGSEPLHSASGWPPGAGVRWKVLDEFLSERWAMRMLWALLGAAVWVGIEMVLARALGGFPWNLLGVSQYRLLPLIQMASVTGVYGVSFVIVWFSLCLVSAGIVMLRRPASRSVWIGEIFLPIITIAILFNLGFRYMRHSPPAGRTLKVTLVQPSIPQTLIWNPENDTARFQDMIRLSEQALSNRTDLLVWPESAIPKLLRYDKETFESLTGLARRHQVWMIVGADDAERRENAKSRDDVDYFNSSFLISPEGKLVDMYRKRSLVIFGEYIPLVRWMPFLKWFTPIQGGFTPGDKPTQFALKDLDIKTCVLICFEDVFPHVARSGMTPEVAFLVNITNDGWFGESSAQWQQAATGLFRTVENGVPLIRCTNNGLTCWIDEHGRLREVFRDRNGSVYGEGFMTFDLPVPPRGESRALTFYARHGDWFGWACTALGALTLVSRFLESRRKRKAAEPV